LGKLGRAARRIAASILALRLPRSPPVAAEFRLFSTSQPVYPRSPPPPLTHACRKDTAALQAQFQRLLSALLQERDAAAEPVRLCAVWDTLPKASGFVDKYGWLTQPGSTVGAPPQQGKQPYAALERSASPQWCPLAAGRASDARGETDAPAPHPPSPSDQAPSSSSNQPAVEVAGRTVVITEEKCALRVEGDELSLRRGRSTLWTACPDDVDLLVIEAHAVSVSAHAARQLAERDISVVMASPEGDDIAVIERPGAARTAMRVLQARSLDLPPVRQAGVAMLEAKVSNQASLLRYLGRAPSRRGNGLGERLLAAADGIRDLAHRLEAEGLDGSGEDQGTLAARLMGYEGRAAALYWSALQELLPSELGFPGRVKQGAADPVNQALNYTYGILYGQVWRAVLRAGLDPGIGILHLAPRSSGGLVYDLIEELRAPLADRVVFSLIGRGWRPETSAENAAGLPPRDRRILARVFLGKRADSLRHGRRKVSVGDLPLLQARSLRDVFEGRSDKYPTFHFRW